MFTSIIEETSTLVDCLFYRDLIVAQPEGRGNFCYQVISLTTGWSKTGLRWDHGQTESRPTPELPPVVILHLIPSRPHPVGLSRRGSFVRPDEDA